MLDLQKETYLDYIKQLNELPMFTDIAKKLDYKRVGIQILKEEEVLREFTSHNKNGKITKIEEGLNNPDFVVGIEENTIKEITSKKEVEWIKKKPTEAMLKYLGKIKIPFAVKLRLLSLLK